MVPEVAAQVGRGEISLSEALKIVAAKSEPEKLEVQNCTSSAERVPEPEPAQVGRGEITLPEAEKKPEAKTLKLAFQPTASRLPQARNPRM